MQVTVQLDDLQHLVRSILVRYGTSHENASAVASACVAAERDGAASHGLFRVKGYVASLKSGWVDGKAVPTVEHAPGTAVIRVHGQNGFAQPALQHAAAPAIEIARSLGTCIVAMRDSHHLAALWPDVEGFGRAGLIALAFVNSISRVVPWGGRAPVYGTNPMALAVPRRKADPLVFDQASSAMSFGDVRLAAQSGAELPPNVAVDRSGTPTRDAGAVLDGGALLPFGEHKGSSIAMMVEVLAAALTGGQFSFEVDASRFPGAETPRTGELVILIDPNVSGTGDFLQRIETLIDRIQGSGATRLPGDRRYLSRSQAAVNGIRIDSSFLDELYRLLD